MTKPLIAAVFGVVATVLALNAAPARAVTYGVGTIALGKTGYAQSFDTLAATGTTGSTLPTGWRASEGGASADATYRVGYGPLDISNPNFGNVHSFGAANSTERALGMLRSGFLTPTVGAIFSNATGGSITDLIIGFTGEQWIDGGGSSDSLNFQYSLTSTNIADALNSKAWISVSSLTFQSPPSSTAIARSLDGNAAANRRALSGTLSGLAIASGATFAFRWLDADASGIDDGLAIDNFTLQGRKATVAAVPEPTSWAMMIAGFALIGFIARRGAVARGRGAVAA